MTRPKILVYDIETAPILGHVWGLWDNNISLNQIERDWHVLSWAAKWLDDPKSKVMYADQSEAKDLTNDKKMLKGLWDLLNEADIVITHNGKKFDEKKINARFILNGMPPTAPYRHIDTLQIAKRRFAFTSNKLEYIADKLLAGEKKSSHKKFSGFELWTECLKGNKQAWKEMKKYNIQDVHVLELVYRKLSAWDSSINFNVYHDKDETVCKCGNDEFHKRGFKYTNSAKYQVYRCTECGHATRGSENLLDKKKRQGLRREL